MRQRSKILMAFGCVVVSLLFCSCSATNSLLEEQLAEQSDIQSDEAWHMYEELKQTGKLNEEGYCIQNELTDAPAEEVPPKGTVHVTFACNAYLSAVYALDEGKSDLVIGSECYLEPGDSLYLASLETDNPYSNQYKAFGFRIYAYKDNGERELISTAPGTAKPVLAIPKNFDKTELSIELIGEYEDRALTFSDYCFNEDGTQDNLNGAWFIEAEGKTEHTTGDSWKVSPVAQYNVRYDFSDYIIDYYFEKSTPVCCYYDDEEGTVQFDPANSQDSKERYSVQLHRYITVDLTNDVAGFLPFLTSGNAIQEIKINGVIWEELDKDKKEQSIPRLRYGDKLVLKVAPQCVVACEGADVEKVERDGMREYAVTIPQTYSTGLHITVSKE